MSDRQPRLTILSYSNGRFDARSRRTAASARAAGFETVMYAKLEPGLALDEQVGDLRVVRVPVDWRLAVPGLRWLGWRAVRRARAVAASAPAGPASAAAAPRRAPAPPPVPRTRSDRLRLALRDPLGYGLPGLGRVATRLVLRPFRMLRRAASIFVIFPLRPIGWGIALEAVAEPSDIWHGMWAGSLPALERLRARHGGKTVYDSRDVYLHARVFDRMRPFMRRLFVRWESRWAQAADLVVTVNDAYADLLVPLLGIERPIIVRNCPDPLPAGAPRDLIRAALGVDAATPVVLYQGGLMTERGIEQSMDAILGVPGAVLVLMGYGGQRALYESMTARKPYRGRVRMLPPVPPEELLEWTASADVMLMAIQPTTLNHRFTTPQKLWEAIAAGVPVVASDMPGMAAVVDEVGCGSLCDPTDPDSIAAAIRSILALDPAARAAMHARTVQAAVDRYNWDAQASVLIDGYRRLLADGAGPAAPA
jgi:glycosyltransferase involved in cell wall biosynthesis